MTHSNPKDPDFHMGAVVCGCHDSKVKTIAPCYLCKNQTKDEQCYKCFKEHPKDPQAELSKKQLKATLIRHFRHGELDVENASNEILALFQAREQQLLTEIVGESIWYQEGGSSPKKAVPVSVIQSKIGELNG